MFFHHKFLYKYISYIFACGHTILYFCFPLYSQETVDQIDDLDSKSSEEEEEEEVAQEHVQADVPMAAILLKDPNIVSCFCYTLFIDSVVDYHR